ncbi:hypothetical protein [Marvinbryantia formatexigens]|nr:hypothetical protein [Marvinbryantia formatexigens]UWO25818.1 hypothetical protein NQ534_04910 [Marvinbryantia formatexigens DSM 14469]SDF38549.1 hypothetical protein SAMN05660368_00627 [Marvinbryantia formatexigens]
MSDILTDGREKSHFQTGERNRTVCRKTLRAMVLTAGGGLLMILLVPAGILFLGISFVWKLTDYLLKKLDNE